MKTPNVFAIAPVMLGIACFVLPKASEVSAKEINAFRPGPVFDALNEKAELYGSEDHKKRIEAFQYFYHLRKFVREMQLGMIDFRVDDFQRTEKLDERGIISPTKALAIAMLADQRPYIDQYRYLFKHLEYQADKVSTLTIGSAYKPDARYPTYVCIPVLRGYGGEITEPMVQYLTSTPKDFVTDKQIELMGYLLHQRYGSGQAAVRIVTVLAEEATKMPHAPNVVRLIDHLGTTYKP